MRIRGNYFCSVSITWFQTVQTVYHQAGLRGARHTLADGSKPELKCWLCSCSKSNDGRYIVEDVFGLVLREMADVSHGLLICSEVKRPHAVRSYINTDRRYVLSVLIHVDYHSNICLQICTFNLWIMIACFFGVISCFCLLCSGLLISRQINKHCYCSLMCVVFQQPKILGDLNWVVYIWVYNEIYQCWPERTPPSMLQGKTTIDNCLIVCAFLHWCWC